MLWRAHVQSAAHFSLLVLLLFALFCPLLCDEALPSLFTHLLTSTTRTCNRTAAKEDAAAAWDAFKGCRRCSTNVSISFVWDVLCDAYPSFAKAITAATGFDRPTATKQIFLLSTSEQRKDPEARLGWSFSALPHSDIALSHTAF